MAVRSHTWPSGVCPADCRWCRDGVPVRVRKVAKAKSLPLCPLLGEDTGERVECKACGGNVQLKVMACPVHGKCTVGKAVGGVACCATCTARPPQNTSQ
jgi:hypothetical protein